MSDNLLELYGDNPSGYVASTVREPDIAPATPPPSSLPENAPGFDGRATVVNAAQRDLATSEATAVAAILGTTLDLLTPTYYASGTELIDQGRDTLRAARASFESMPDATSALDGLVAAVKAERRRDVTMPLADLHVDASGVLRRRGAPAGLVLDDAAWWQLAQRAPDHVPSRLRSNVNAWLASSPDVACFRTRKPNVARGLREGFAVVSPRYEAYDVDAIAADIRANVPPGTKAEVIYDGRRMVANLILENPMNIDEAGVGRLHRVAVSVRSMDNGQGGYRRSFKAIRIRCLNATTICDEGLRQSLRHTRNSGFADAVRASVAEAMGALDTFATTWASGFAAQYHDRYDGTPLGALDTFRRLVYAELVKVPGFGRDELVDALMASWEREPGDTVAHVNMAITALHQTGKLSPWAQEDAEDQAGELLYARNVLAPVPLDVAEEWGWS